MPHCTDAARNATHANLWQLIWFDFRRTLLGSALRLDVNTPDNVPYTVPPSNPFHSMQPTPDVRQEIFAYGLRNPWRCSQDRGDREANFTGRGRIFCGDVGQNRYEEVAYDLSLQIIPSTCTRIH